MLGEEQGVAGEIEEFEKIKEEKGKLGYGSELMKSVLENDQQKIDDGKLIEEALDRGMGAFTPDIMFQNLVKNYSFAKKLYGETLLQRISGYDEKYIYKNIKVPEFQRELKQKIDDKLQELRKQGFVDKGNSITETGIEMASLVLYIEELDRLQPIGKFGERFHKLPDMHGVESGIKIYGRGDRYRDISIPKSTKTAIRRGHKKLLKEDLKIKKRQSKGAIEVIYAIDSSASMKGPKIKAAKKAGVALAFRAIEEKDKVGLIVFGEEVKSKQIPTHEFGLILKEITKIRSFGQTNLVLTLKEAVNLFSGDDVTKHLLLLTDALPTVGKEPERETLEAVSFAVSHGITVSLVGLGLDKKGRKLAEKITQLGQGRFYIVEDIKDLDKVVLLDYYGL